MWETSDVRITECFIWAKPTHLEWAPIGRKRFWNVMFLKEVEFLNLFKIDSANLGTPLFDIPQRYIFKRNILDAKFFIFQIWRSMRQMGPFCLIRLWPEAKINFVRRYLLKNGNNDVWYFSFFPKGSLNFYNFSCYICLVMSGGAQYGSSIYLVLNFLLDWIEKNILGLPDIMCLSFWLLSFLA